MEKIPPPYYLCLCQRSMQSVKLSPSLAALLKEQVMWEDTQQQSRGNREIPETWTGTWLLLFESICICTAETMQHFKRISKALTPTLGSWRKTDWGEGDVTFLSPSFSFCVSSLGWILLGQMELSALVPCFEGLGDMTQFILWNSLSFYLRYPLCLCLLEFPCCLRKMLGMGGEMVCELS